MPIVSGQRYAVALPRCPASVRLSLKTRKPARPPGERRASRRYGILERPVAVPARLALRARKGRAAAVAFARNQW